MPFDSHWLEQQTNILNSDFFASFVHLRKKVLTIHYFNYNLRLEGMTVDEKRKSNIDHWIAKSDWHDIIKSTFPLSLTIKSNDCSTTVCFAYKISRRTFFYKLNELKGIAGIG